MVITFFLLKAFLGGVATWCGSFIASKIVGYAKRKWKRRKKTTHRANGKKGGRRKRSKKF